MAKNIVLVKKHRWKMISNQRLQRPLPLDFLLYSIDHWPLTTLAIKHIIIICIQTYTVYTVVQMSMNLFYN